MGADPYSARAGLEYIGEKPRFLQKILQGQQQIESDMDARRDARIRPHNLEDDPLLVDSEGNAIPDTDNITSSDVVTLDDDNLDSEFVLDEEEVEKLTSHYRNIEEQPEENPRKKYKLTPQKQLSKLKSDHKLLSFDQEDVE